MKKLHGVGASDGITMGRLVLFQRGRAEVEKHSAADVESELRRLKEAQKKAVGAMERIYLNSLRRVGEKDSMIFQIHKMMLEDEDFSQSIRDRIIREKVNAEYAVMETGKEFAKRFAKMDSAYMRARKTDVIDISRRLIRCFGGGTGEERAVSFNGPAVLAADDLTPSETMQLDKSRVLAIVTRGGSRTSHSAILSRTMGIPSVVNLGDDFENLKAGENVVVDGTSGDVILEPDGAALADCRKLREEYLQSRRELRRLLGRKVVTRDGRTMEVNANIGHPGDAEDALENGADGIGLFRSEFLYMERDSLPTEEEQFQAYRQV